MIRHINWVDVLVVILIIRISYVAFQEGLSREIFPFLGVMATLTGSLHYYEKIGFLISKDLFNLSPEISNFLSFVILAIIITLIFKLLKVLVDKIIKVEWHPFIERFGGLLIGLARAAITTSLILMIIALVPVPYLQKSIRDKSVSGMYFLKIGPLAYSKVYKFLPNIQAEGVPPVNEETIIQKLVSDKVIRKKDTTKEGKKTSEWEK